MSNDWQKGSGFVKEPKVTRDVGKNKDGYGDAETIETPNPQESQTVDVKGTKALRKDKKPVKATWF
jgi:hypothetical protein